MNTHQVKTWIVRELHGLLSAVMLLTRLPVSFVGPHISNLPGALAWYPAVGLVIGGLLLLFQQLLLLAGGGAVLTAALLMAFWVLVTGALHLDGLADMVDGWVGGLGERERTLKIMKDPATGAMGAVALVVVLLIKAAALVQLLSANASSIIWAVPVIARCGLLGAFLWVPSASDTGMAATVKQEQVAERSWCSMFITLLLLVFLVPLPLLLCWLLAGAAVFGLWWRAVLRRLDGFNGDCAGALVELTELALLLVACFVMPVLVEGPDQTGAWY